MGTSASHQDKDGSSSHLIVDYSNGISTIKQIRGACRPGCASLTCLCTGLAVLSRQIQQQLFQCAAGLPSPPHLLQGCVRASNQVMINISTYCLLTLATTELPASPVLPQETPPHPYQNCRKTRFCMAQSPMAQTQKPQVEQPANLYAGKTHEECMVTSQ